MKITGSDLRRMRLRAGKTTLEMAQYAGVKTRKTYENWEKGISAPNINQFLDMASSCGYDAKKIIGLAKKRKDIDEPIQAEQALTNVR